MPLRSAAALGLALLLLPPALAETGGLRGAGPNGTGAGAAGSNGTTGAASASGGGDGPSAALDAVGGELPPAWVAENLENLTLGAMASTGGNWYLDGECRPCPARLYHHCSRGGRLMWSIPCYGGALCQGMCTHPGSAPAGSSPGHIHASPAGIRTLYHETSPAAARSILATGFRPGHTGYCGAAIYFYGRPNVPSTKLGPSSQRGAVIEAKVDLGTMAHLDSTCDGADAVRRRYDSATFNPGDGDEYVIFSKARVISMRRYS